MNRVKELVITAVIIVLGLLPSSAVLGFGGEMHEQITLRAEYNDDYFANNELGLFTEEISLNPLIFSLESGRNTNMFKTYEWTMSEKEWLVLGAKVEDSPLGRAQYHFHNHRLPWKDAGLDNQDYKWLFLNKDTALLATALLDIGTSRFDLKGSSALLWALFNHTPGVQEHPSIYDLSQNNFNIWRAKRYLYIAMTGDKDMDGNPDLSSQNATALESYYALHLLSMGTVMHLLEDMGVPGSGDIHDK